MPRHQQLIEYEKENGDFNVPKDVPGLGSWVIYQRVQYKSFLEGKPSTVNKTKVDKLLSIGFFEQQLLEKPLGEVEMVQQPIHEVFPTQLERIDTIQQLQQHHGHIYDANDNTVEYDWAPPTYNNSSPHMDL